VSLCHNCHTRWEQDPGGEYTIFIKKQIGGGRYKALEKMARRVFKLQKGDLITKIKYFRTLIKDRSKIW
jgi:hypothetical protein